MNNFKLNWKRQPKDDRDLVSTRHLTAPVTLPKSFDLGDIPVYDQLEIGSCVANGGSLAYRYEYREVKGDFKFEPSRLYAYYNVRAEQGWEKEDSGAFVRDIFKTFNKLGLCEETFCPYITENFANKPSNAAYENGKKYQTLKYAAVPQNETVIKQTLLSGAVVVFGFDVYDNFIYGDWTEICPVPEDGKSPLGGHCVSIIGYDDAKQAFLIQNSWSSDWKINGRFWMPYSFLLNSKYADDFWCIQEISISEGITPDPTNKIIDAIKLIYTEELLLDESKPMIKHLAELVGCDLKGLLRSKLAKQLRDFIYKI